jgi:hypothetical protein
MVVLHLPEPSLCGDINESVRAAGRDAGTAAEDTVTVFHAFNMHLDSAPKKATFFKVLILVHKFIILNYSLEALWSNLESNFTVL